MGNMSYCRMENTYKDLLDCWNDGQLRNTRVDELEDHSDLSESERGYAKSILELAKELVEMNEEY
jgi:hypothetical protein